LFTSLNLKARTIIQIEEVVNKHKYPPVFAEKEVNWSHPVLNVFKKYGIHLHKIRYFSDGTCPAFHVDFETYSKTKDFHKVYEEILKANSKFPYALIDEKKDLMVDVGWSDDVPSKMKIDVGKSSSTPDCKVGSRTMSYKFRMSPKLKKNILSSPYHAPMRRQGGKELVAYLYAENGERKETTYYTDQGDEKTTTSIEGNFYIYLYDPVKDKFFPKKFAVFYPLDTFSMDWGRSSFIVLPRNKKTQSDVLLISVFATAAWDEYEAYGFSEDQSTLKKYRFIKKNSNYFAFNGRLYPYENRVYGYTRYEGFEYAEKNEARIEQYRLEVSDKPGEIIVKDSDRE
jgi:hypothetical protein